MGFCCPRLVSRSQPADMGPFQGPVPLKIPSRSQMNWTELGSYKSDMYLGGFDRKIINYSNVAKIRLYRIIKNEFRTIYFAYAAPNSRQAVVPYRIKCKMPVQRSPITISSSKSVLSALSLLLSTICSILH